MLINDSELFDQSGGGDFQQLKSAEESRASFILQIFNIDTFVLQPTEKNIEDLRHGQLTGGLPASRLLQCFGEQDHITGHFTKGEKMFSWLQ